MSRENDLKRYRRWYKKNKAHHREKGKAWEKKENAETIETVTRRNVKWTDIELRWLKYHRANGWTYKQIAKLLGRTRHAVRGQLEPEDPIKHRERAKLYEKRENAKTIATATRRKLRWTTEELDILRAYRGEGFSFKQIALFMGRTRQGVSSVAKRIALPPYTPKLC